MVGPGIVVVCVTVAFSLTAPFIAEGKILVNTDSEVFTSHRDTLASIGDKRKCGVFKSPWPQITNQCMLNKTCSNDSACPPWFRCINNECKCGPNHHQTICCDNELQQSAVLDCYCMTHDENTGETITGACFYNCVNGSIKGVDTVYHLLPQNVSHLNKIMCGHLNRTGPLCGQCVDGSYPQAYSYNMNCVYCPDGHKNWFKFILVAFVPLTFFYFFVLFFKINATSSHFHGFVLYSQVISVPALIRIVLRAVETNSPVLNTAKAVFTLYGFWNLDFFRTVIPRICLQTTTLQTLALDYTIAVYPLLLMIISYVFIELHDQNCHMIVFLWKPFRLILTFFRRNWDSRTSVIDAYATFFLLSSMKFLSVSFDLLVPARLHKLSSGKSTLVLFYDGSIEYFGREHLPYAVLAIIVLLLFIIFPIMVLLLYPLRPFQKILTMLPTRVHFMLHTFVDSFQGCYKDGTEPGTRDCRWFAALFLIWRIASFILYAVTLGSAFTDAGIFISLLLVVLLIAVWPFRSTVAKFNKINVIFVLLITMTYAGIAGTDISTAKGQGFHKPYVMLTTVSAIIPLIYVTCIVIHWIFSRRKWGTELIQRLHAWRKGYNIWIPEETVFEELLPDRMVNPTNYHEGNLSVSNNRSISNNLSNTVY